VIGLLQNGETVDTIVTRCFPNITRAQVYECLAYYEDHRGEIACWSPAKCPLGRREISCSITTLPTTSSIHWEPWATRCSSSVRRCRPRRQIKRFCGWLDSWR
jgi:hypothetical protein